MALRPLLVNFYHVGMLGSRGVALTGVLSPSSRSFAPKRKCSVPVLHWMPATSSQMLMWWGTAGQLTLLFFQAPVRPFRHLRCLYGSGSGLHEGAYAPEGRIWSKNSPSSCAKDWRLLYYMGVPIWARWTGASLEFRSSKRLQPDTGRHTENHWSKTSCHTRCLQSR